MAGGQRSRGKETFGTFLVGVFAIIFSAHETTQDDDCPMSFAG